LLPRTIATAPATNAALLNERAAAGEALTGHHHLLEQSPLLSWERGLAYSNDLDKLSQKTSWRGGGGGAGGGAGAGAGAGVGLPRKRALDLFSEPVEQLEDHDELLLLIGKKQTWLCGLRNSWWHLSRSCLLLVPSSWNDQVMGTAKEKAHVLAQGLHAKEKERGGG